jgi:hypothetical protein
VGLRIGETEGALGLVGGDATGDLNNVLVESSTHEVKVREDESLLHVKSDSDNVGGVLAGEFLDIGNGELRTEEEFLVVSQHDDKGDIEDILKPLGEGEGNHMTEMHRVGGRSTSSVKEERLALLISVEDFLKVAVGEEHSTAEEDVRTVTGELFEALKKLRGNAPGSELVQELLIVDGGDVSGGVNLSGNLPRVDILASGRGGSGVLGNVGVGESFGSNLGGLGCVGHRVLEL